MDIKDQDNSAKSPATAQIINHLLVQPHTSASLVQKLGVFSASYINACLRKLRKAGLIDAIWDHRNVCLIYYNLKLKEDEKLKKDEQFDTEEVKPSLECALLEESRARR